MDKHRAELCLVDVGKVVFSLPVDVQPVQLFEMQQIVFRSQLSISRCIKALW